MWKLLSSSCNSFQFTGEADNINLPHRGCVQIVPFRTVYALCFICKFFMLTEAYLTILFFYACFPRALTLNCSYYSCNRCLKKSKSVRNCWNRHTLCVCHDKSLYFLFCFWSVLILMYLCSHLWPLCPLLFECFTYFCMCSVLLMWSQLQVYLSNSCKAAVAFQPTEIQMYIYAPDFWKY